MELKYDMTVRSRFRAGHKYRFSMQYFEVERYCVGYGDKCDVVERRNRVGWGGEGGGSTEEGGRRELLFRCESEEGRGPTMEMGGMGGEGDGSGDEVLPYAFPTLSNRRQVERPGRLKSAWEWTAESIGGKI